MTAKPKMFCYHGRSMWPYFQEGDLLEYTACELHDIKIGDCVVFKGEDDKVVTHRLIKKSQRLSTRGDAHINSDTEEVAAEQLLGRVVKRHRHGSTAIVTGGLTGLATGALLHYAGRIDPRRETRGGKVARAIRAVSMTILKPVWQLGYEQALLNHNSAETSRWKIGKTTIAWKRNKDQEWQIPWPLISLVTIQNENSPI